ncbi:MAG TPA: hypothetical protein VML58_09710 [Burkholderiaceae bacterium]|nr:hypothetical protein [Burkholderiaceae bacterium]
MKDVQRVMRVMTHVNLGATLGLVAWLLWSGYAIASDPLQDPASTSPAKRLLLQPAAACACRSGRAPVPGDEQVPW